MRYERDTRGQNFFALDPNLQGILKAGAGGDPETWRETLSAFGAWVGDEVDAEAEQTDRFARPVLESYDRDGVLANHIRHDPAWDAVSREVYERGIVGLNYGDAPAPFLLTFAMGYLLSQADVSLHCPVAMTGAMAYVLERFAPREIKQRYLPELVRRDGRALTGGTWVTERQGGSDVGANQTTARLADGGPGLDWRLTGLKWFVSNVDGGLALVTARPQEAPEGTAGLGFYLVPRRLDTGEANPLRIRRLKDKLGTCGVATAEVDLTETHAAEVAPPPEGFKLMMEALGFSRLHNAMASCGLQRRAFLEVMSFASHRVAFGRPLLDHAMVRTDVLRLLAELEAGCALAFEAARAFDTALADDGYRPWLRLATALAKYQTAEDANAACRTAIEVIGGNGYTYDFVTPRLLRDAQVMTVWEGPANIQALEVLRMLGDRHHGFEAFTRRIETCCAAAPVDLIDLRDGVAAALTACRNAVSFVRGDAGRAARHARRLMALLADTLCAALLLEEATRDLEHGDRRKAIVARLYLDLRLTPPPRRGIVPEDSLAEQHFPALVGYEPVETSLAASRRATG